MSLTACAGPLEVTTVQGWTMYTQSILVQVYCILCPNTPMVCFVVIYCMYVVQIHVHVLVHVYVDVTESSEHLCTPQELYVYTV